MADAIVKIFEQMDYYYLTPHQSTQKFVCLTLMTVVGGWSHRRPGGFVRKIAERCGQLRIKKNL